jgi:uncharacterized paraquat-inducible protein A
MKRIIILVIAFASGFGCVAQKSKNNQLPGKTQGAQNTYTCPMHPDVVSDKPGKCPRCGKNLSLSRKEQMKMEVMNIYTCPMHPDMVSDKPGKCPKCGKNLSLSRKEQMKMEVMNIYTCPMHPDVQSDKPGKCPQCGMTLKEKKTEN